MSEGEGHTHTRTHPYTTKYNLLSFSTFLHQHAVTTLGLGSIRLHPALELVVLFDLGEPLLRPLVILRRGLGVPAHGLFQAALNPNAHYSVGKRDVEWRSRRSKNSSRGSKSDRRRRVSRGNEKLQHAPRIQNIPSE